MPVAGLDAQADRVDPQGAGDVVGDRLDELLEVAGVDQREAGFVNPRLLPDQPARTVDRRRLSPTRRSEIALQALHQVPAEIDRTVLLAGAGDRRRGQDGGQFRPVGQEVRMAAQPVRDPVGREGRWRRWSGNFRLAHRPGPRLPPYPAFSAGASSDRMA